MGITASRVNEIIDLADAVTLRDIADGAETATATETGKSLSELRAAYWHNKEIPHGVFKVVFNVTAVDRTTGDEAYTLALVVDDTADMSDNPSVIASLAITTAGVYTMFVDSKNIPQIDPDTSGTDKWIAARATLGGTTPIITYGAWIARARGAQ